MLNNFYWRHKSYDDLPLYKTYIWTLHCLCILAAWTPNVLDWGHLHWNFLLHHSLIPLLQQLSMNLIWYKLQHLWEHKERSGNLCVLKLNPGSTFSEQFPQPRDITWGTFIAHRVSVLASFQNNLNATAHPALTQIQRASGVRFTPNRTRKQKPKELGDQIPPASLLHKKISHHAWELPGREQRCPRQKPLVTGTSGENDKDETNFLASCQSGQPTRCPSPKGEGMRWCSCIITTCRNSPSKTENSKATCSLLRH